MKTLHLISAVILLAMTNLASAQIQRCVDSDGRVTFTDNVCAKNSVNGKSVRANQKMVGSGNESGGDISLAAKNEAFNQRQAQRDRTASNERIVHDFLTTPLPPGAKSKTLTTYTDRPPKQESR